MKKLLSLFVVTIICITLTGCTRSITYSTFKKNIKNKESMIVEVVQTGCSHCEAFEPKFKEFTSEHNLTYVKLNISNISQEEYNELSSTYGIEGTPTVLLIKNGKHLDEFKIAGDVSKEELTNVFTNAGYIKEKK